MDEHLGYSKHVSAGRNGGDSRNGTRSKTVITEIGRVDIDVPRDRGSTFEPATVPSAPLTTRDARRPIFATP